MQRVLLSDLEEEEKFEEPIFIPTNKNRRKKKKHLNKLKRIKKK